MRPCVERALFVSDIHVTSDQDPKYALLLRLLEACPKLAVTQLFLVGDIFDFWIADRPHFLRTYHALIAIIRKLRAHGVNIHYFEGNHDLDLIPFWHHQLGVKVHSEAAHFTLNGVKYRVEHGDQMDPSDRGYLFLRGLLRTPVMVFLGRRLPDRLVRWIGERSSRASREYTTQIKTASDEEVRAKIREYARRVRDDCEFEILVSGHVHVRDDCQLTTPNYKFRSINLGTWLKEPLVLDVQGAVATLKRVEDLL